MRMWMVSPDIMCSKHLIGEHGELHMINACLREQKNLSGFAEINALELCSLSARHEVLVEEILFRGFEHNSPMDTIFDYRYLPEKVYTTGVDRKRSLRRLTYLCSKCQERYILQYFEGENWSPEDFKAVYMKEYPEDFKQGALIT